MDEDKKQKVVSLFKAGSKAATKKQSMQPCSSIKIGGSNSGLVAGRDVHITTERIVTKPKIDIRPGSEHVSDAQKAKLTALVAEIIELEKAVKKKPATYQSVWSSLNRSMKVTSYHLIQSSDYAKAEKKLREWIGRLSSSKTARKKAPGWRKRKYAFIKINTKDDEAWIESYLHKNFDAESISELNDDELDRVYRAVSSRKRSVVGGGG